MTAVPNPLDSLTRAELLYLVKAQIWLRADISWARYLAASAAAFEAWRKLSAEEESVAPAGQGDVRGQHGRRNDAKHDTPFLSMVPRSVPVLRASVESILRGAS